MKTTKKDFKGLVNPGELLIMDLLELHSLEKNIEKWNLSFFEKNLPRYYYLKRIDALLASLSIDDPYPLLFDGYFLKKDSGLTAEEMVKHVPSMKDAIDKRDRFIPIDMEAWTHVYKRVMKHLLDLNSALDINSGTMIASGIFGYGVHITNETNKNIWPLMKDEIDLIVWMLNPQSAEYSFEELNEKYDYPLDNMNEIIIDSM